MLRLLNPLIFLSLFPHPHAGGATPVQEPPADGAAAWEFTGAAGLSLTAGNSESLAYNIRFLASRTTNAHESWFSADYHYADDDGTKSTDALRLGVQHDHRISERFYLGVTGGFLADSLADVDYRFDLGTHIGWHAVKAERARLSFEAGPGYAWEKQGGATEDYASLRFAQKFNYRIGNRVRMTQSLAFTPQADDFSNHLLVAEAGFEVRLTDRLALNTLLRHRIDNTPAAGREKNDTTIIQGLSYILGGQPAPDHADEARRSLMPDAPPASVTPPGWTAEAAVGFALARGNADNLSLSFTSEMAHRSDEGEFFLNSAYQYSENANVTSSDTLRVNAKYNRFIDDSWFAGGGLEFFRDPLADIDYRITPGAQIGRYLIKNDETTLSIEAGPAFTFEQAGNQREEYATLQVAQRFSQSVGANVTVNQAVVARSDVRDLDRYTVLATCSLDVRLNSRLSWRNAATWHFENQPATGKQRQDTTLTSGIAVRFW